MDTQKLKHLPRIDALREAIITETIKGGRDNSSYISIHDGSLNKQLENIVEVAEVTTKRNSSLNMYENKVGGILGYGRSNTLGHRFFANIFGLTEIEGVLALAYACELPQDSLIPRTISFTPLFQIECYASYGGRRESMADTKPLQTEKEVNNHKEENKK